jgi:acetate kinase
MPDTAAGGRVRDGLSPDDSRGTDDLRDTARVDRRSTACGGTAFTGRRIATSRRGWPSSLGRDDLRIISCHLGGSSSLCAIEGGQSVANSFGMTPQCGLPQNNRVGDFDAYALILLRQRTGLDYEELLAKLSREGGLLGISGLSNDMPALLEAAEGGHAGAQLAIGTFVESVRHYLGAYLVALGGLDVLAFTGGIGERSPAIRARICAGLAGFGIRLDAERNAAAEPEATLSPDDAPVKIMKLQTNEELIVARQTVAVLQDERRD